MFNLILIIPLFELIHLILRYEVETIVNESCTMFLCDVGYYVYVI